MLFIHTIDKVLSGQKTQTRRLVKPDDTELIKPLDTDLVFSEGDKLFTFYKATETRDITSVERNGRHIYNVGQTYAVQPGRGKPAVARIRITDIRCEDVREISAEDAKAEGFESVTHFLLVWTQMHDSKIYNRYPTTGQISLALEQGVIQDHPANRYQAWALTFELVQP